MFFISRRIARSKTLDSDYDEFESVRRTTSYFLLVSAAIIAIAIANYFTGFLDQWEVLREFEQQMGLRGIR